MRDCIICGPPSVLFVAEWNEHGSTLLGQTWAVKHHDSCQCTCVPIFVCVYLVYRYICMVSHICMNMFTYVPVFMHGNMHLHVLCTCIHAFTHMYPYKDSNGHTHLHICVSVITCMVAVFVNACLCLFVGVGADQEPIYGSVCGDHGPKFSVHNHHCLLYFIQLNSLLGLEQNPLTEANSAWLFSL